MPRLAVNVSDQTAHNFQTLILRKGLSITEGVRRAVAVWAFVEREIRAGNRLAVVEPDGAVRRVKVLP